jgi:hypothetical protein
MRTVFPLEFPVPRSSTRNPGRSRARRDRSWAVQGKTMKYDVKNEYGQLTFGSLKELYVLYQRHFVTDDDLVRRHGTDRWIAAGSMPELKGARERVADRSTPIWAGIMLGFVFFAGLLLRRIGSPAWLGCMTVVFVGVTLGAWFRFRHSSGGASRFLARPERAEAVSPRQTTGTDHGQGQDAG